MYIKKYNMRLQSDSLQLAKTQCFEEVWRGEEALRASTAKVSRTREMLHRTPLMPPGSSKMLLGGRVTTIT